MNPLRLLLLLLGVTLLGCSQQPSPPSTNARWALMPLTNHSQDEEAAARAEPLVAAQLHALGITHLQQMPATETEGSTPQLHQAHRQQQARQWQAQHPVDLLVTGEINQWTIDSQGVPRVELGLELIRQTDQAPLWQTAIAAAGRQGESLEQLAQRLITQAMASLPLSQ
ncbi:DUF4136 domain-containing protein [Aestuariirhabdus litorea]|uniref:DUF4136 domain-containing protein n=1 Tax=Aestuariirhabdus litorea TaxID=2528527 RepID=A0A3P3VLE5_9GAMM|nr:DUF4136 domain-containing protein [Aestuariirhabdus litorea]RRJ82549.1 hypothetical protein D0544_11820 [Aestuariirhabdus litorea]RWW92710.1 hypothetical protein DZC74_11795 [Endozoicomonadaceae bacterium GTF-13]